jgi:aerobic-type carbon monoxide dehydrogenase small subunit (CoxS/CutS family)
MRRVHRHRGRHGGALLRDTRIGRANPDPTDGEIREGMEGVLCRCMTYYRVQAAIRRAARDAGE